MNFGIDSHLDVYQGREYVRPIIFPNLPGSVFLLLYQTFDLLRFHVKCYSPPIVFDGNDSLDEQ